MQKSSILDVSQGSVYASVLVLKLQVLFIKHTSSKFIVTHFEGIAIFDVVFARINETLCPLSDVTLSKNLELLCDCMFATNTKTIIYIT